MIRIFLECDHCKEVVEESFGNVYAAEKFIEEELFTKRGGEVDLCKKCEGVIAEIKTKYKGLLEKDIESFFGKEE
jgi:hypothetical protein